MSYHLVISRINQVNYLSLYKLSDITSKSLDSIAKLGVWLPVVLTGYFLLRALKVPSYVGPLLLILVLVFNIGKHYQFLKKGKGGQVTPLLLPSYSSVELKDNLIVLLFVGLLILTLIPIIRLFFSLGLGEFPKAFLYVDHTFLLMITQGLKTSFPPIDLSYYGENLRYHLGGPLLVEMIHRYTTLPVHTIFYGILPALLKIIMIASLYRIFTLLFPGWSVKRYLLGLFLIGGVFVIDPYNIIWNIQNIIRTGTFSSRTILIKMPIVTILYDDYAYFQYAFWNRLALVFFLGLLANIDRVGFISPACVLFAIFITKLQIFIPIGMAWGCYALYMVYMYKNYRFLTAGLLVLIFSIYTISYSSSYGSLITLKLGLGNFKFEQLFKPGHYLSKALGIEALASIIILGTLSKLAGLHVVGFSVAREIARSWTVQTIHGKTILQLSIFSILVALLFVTFFVLEPSPLLQARFNEIHQGIRNALSFPFETHLRDTLDTAVYNGPVLLAKVLLSILGAAGMLSWCKITTYRSIKVVLMGVIGVAIAISCWYLYIGIFGSLSRDRWMKDLKIVTEDATRALLSIPKTNTIILTNELSYYEEKRTLFSLMNTWGPALLGHQFWASNFMYGGTFSHPDAYFRLKKTKWFWNTQLSDKHYEFLQEQGINYLFVRRDLLHQILENVAWIDLVYENNKYLVYHVQNSR